MASHTQRIPNSDINKIYTHKIYLRFFFKKITYNIEILN